MKLHFESFFKAQWNSCGNLSYLAKLFFPCFCVHPNQTSFFPTALLKCAWILCCHHIMNSLSINQIITLINVSWAAEKKLTCFQLGTINLFLQSEDGIFSNEDFKKDKSDILWLTLKLHLAFSSSVVDNKHWGSRWPPCQHKPTQKWLKLSRFYINLGKILCGSSRESSTKVIFKV